MYLLRGALTSKPYSFVARSWELKNVESVDFFDSINSSVKFELRGDKIVRVLPKLNESLNEDWISDKIRFVADGFRVQRVDNILLNNGRHNFVTLNWSTVILFLCSIFKIEYNNINTKLKTLLNFGQFIENQKLNTSYIFGSFLDLKSESWFNQFFNVFNFKKNNILLNENVSLRKHFFFNFKIKNLIRYENIVLFTNNIRYSSPVLNIRLRQCSLKNNLIVLFFGSNFLSSFPILFLGGTNSFVKFLSGSHWLFSKVIRAKSLFLFDFFTLKKMPFLSLEERFLVKYNKNIDIGIIHNNSSTLINSEVGNTCINPSGSNPNYVLYNSLPSLLKLRDNKKLCKRDSFTQLFITMVHHGDSRLLNVDFILPVSTLYERTSLLLNNEGKCQESRFIIQPPKNVLDLKDLLIFLMTILFRNQKINFSQTNLFFTTIYSRLFSSNSLEYLWNFVFKFLDSFNNQEILSISFLLKEFIPIFNFNVEILETTELRNSINIDYSQTINNRLNNFLMSPIPEYYVQDEITSSSFTLSSASDKLSSKLTYNL